MFETDRLRNVRKNFTFGHDLVEFDVSLCCATDAETARLYRSSRCEEEVDGASTFLADMDAAVPWGSILALIEPHFPNALPESERVPMPVETMLRIYFPPN